MSIQSGIAINDLDLLDKLRVASELAGWACCDYTYGPKKLHESNQGLFIIGHWANDKEPPLIMFSRKFKELSIVGSSEKYKIPNSNKNEIYIQTTSSYINNSKDCIYDSDLKPGVTLDLGSEPVEFIFVWGKTNLAIVIKKDGLFQVNLSGRYKSQQSSVEVYEVETLNGVGKIVNTRLPGILNYG